MRIERFRRNTDGNIAVLFALLAPLLICAVGAGVDFQRWNNQRAGLQDAVDALALRGASELLLANASETNIRNLLRATAAGEAAFDVANMKVSVDVGDGSVTVEVREPPDPGLVLTKVRPYKDDFIVDATAEARGGANVCVIATEPSDGKALAASVNARLLAKDCAIYSNSKSKSGVFASGSALLQASMICSAGGETRERREFRSRRGDRLPGLCRPIDGSRRAADRRLRLSRFGGRQGRRRR